MFAQGEIKQGNCDECGIPLKEYKIVAVRVKKLNIEYTLRVFCSILCMIRYFHYHSAGLIIEEGE